jgi:glycosyltransferase involved in cell wall biosynthesis
MKKVAILGPNLDNRGGVNVVIKNLKKGFEEYGYKVTLFPVGKTSIKCSDDVIPIDTNEKSQQIKLAKYLIKDKYDLIIANNLRTHYILEKLNLKNSLYLFHQGSLLVNKGLWNNIKQKIKFKKIYKNKNLIFLNECFKNEFIKKFNINANYFVIPNGYDFEEIINKSNQLNFNKEYIISVGRLEKSKRVDLLIKAYSMLNLKEELWILGEGREKKHLIDLVRTLNISKKVKFLGWQDNPYPYVKNAKLNVFLTEFESFGNVIIESLILKTPIIASKVKCGPISILKGNLENLLVKNELLDIKSKIKTILHNNFEIKKEFYEEFDYKKVVKKYIELFDS